MNTPHRKPPLPDQTGDTLLLVDDDPIYRDVLANALQHRGFDVAVAGSAAQAQECLTSRKYGYAIVDLRMPDGSGLSIVENLHQTCRHTRIVVLTGYASIATAVEAIKLGATHYLTKPAPVDDIIQAFDRRHGDASTAVKTTPMSIERNEWEYLQKVLRDFNGNISAAARSLSMHRRTLQRKLNKHPVRF